MYIQLTDSFSVQTVQIQFLCDFIFCVQTVNQLVSVYRQLTSLCTDSFDYRQLIDSVSCTDSWFSFCVQTVNWFVFCVQLTDSVSVYRQLTDSVFCVQTVNQFLNRQLTDSVFCVHTVNWFVFCVQTVNWFSFLCTDS